LEGIQNIAGDASEGFRRYLHSETAMWWDKLNAFWSGAPRALLE